RVFHGTKCEHADSINIYGLKASTEGRLGPGIYLTVRDVAKQIAKYRGQGNEIYLIEVELDVGQMKVLPGSNDDRLGYWSAQGYDTCQSIHPAWIVNHPFPEWCVRDSSRLRIIGMQQIG
ncbi:unnamed protein product, partial [Rotaria sp. Silwood1]